MLANTRYLTSDKERLYYISLRTEAIIKVGESVIQGYVHTYKYLGVILSEHLQD